MSSQPDTVRRQAGRVIVLDPDQRVLLVEYVRDSGERFWATPGGGLLEEESFERAARRELAEELGIQAGPLLPLFQAESRFTFGGEQVVQEERYFLLRLDDPEIPEDPDMEDARMMEGIISLRWWALEEIEAARVVIFPEGLAGHVRRSLQAS
jgi:8-oxo-dGTP pyrophosphatase MutT (NUDIX family)